MSKNVITDNITGDLQRLKKMLNCLIMLTKRENSQKLYGRIFGVISRHTLRFVCAEFNFWPINVKKNEFSSVF